MAYAVVERNDAAFERPSRAGLRFALGRTDHYLASVAVAKVDPSLVLVLCCDEGGFGNATELDLNFRGGSSRGSQK